MDGGSGPLFGFCLFGSEWFGMGGGWWATSWLVTLVQSGLVGGWVATFWLVTLVQSGLVWGVGDGPLFGHTG